MLLTALLACEDPVVLGSDPDDEAAVRALLALPDHIEVPAIPANNPLTTEKIELGRHLFYDRRLSANEEQSCADCHLPERAFTDGVATPEGSTGQPLVRNSQGLANVAWRGTLTWAHDGLVELEQQLLVPLTNDRPVELGISDGARDRVLARFAEDDADSARFAAAFPELGGDITLEAVTFALASFCRSLVSAGSPYDAYLAGDREALTPEESAGLLLFNGERFECFHCHGGVHLTASYRDARTADPSVSFFNTGLYNVDGEGSYPARDQGLFDLTLDPADRGAFRPPSLRNVALTAPYMHDGSVPTLRDAVLHYVEGGRLTTSGPDAGDGRTNPLRSSFVRPFDATDDEIDAVVAFLRSTTDPVFVDAPQHGPPPSR